MPKRVFYSVFQNRINISAIQKFIHPAKPLSKSLSTAYIPLKQKKRKIPKKKSK